MGSSDPRPEEPTVLVVDDERATLDLYAKQLAGEYTVHTASSGEEAMELLDSRVDIVLLDRRMPGLSGEDVLAEIRAREADCRVVMITAVEPDLRIIDLPFDEYLTKPVSEETLRDAVERMLVRNEYDARLQEFVALVSKMATLESKLDIADMEASDEYAELKTRCADLRAELGGGDQDEDLYAEFTTEKIQAWLG